MYIEFINGNCRTFYLITSDFNVSSGKINQMGEGNIRDVITSDQSEINLNNGIICLYFCPPHKNR